MKALLELCLASGHLLFDQVTLFSFWVFPETVARMWTRKAWTFRKKAYFIAIFIFYAKTRLKTAVAIEQ